LYYGRFRAGVWTFTEHALAIDGTPNEPIVFAHPHTVSGTE